MNELCESEKSRLHKWSNFQLPNRFKKIGWVIVLIAIALSIGRNFVDGPEWVRPLFRNVILLGLLMVSISKEKIEDELVVSLRAKSYRLAFIWGVLYTLVRPYIDYAVDYIITGDGELDFGSFQIILFILLIQIMFFYALKRTMK